MNIEQHPTRGDALTAYLPMMTRASVQEPVVEFIGTDDSEDRYGSVLSVTGWETAAYLRNPVILWAHQYDRPPVGRTLSLTRTANALNFRVRFAVEESEFAAEVFRLVKGGYLSGLSVGFIPKAAEEYEPQTVSGHYTESKRYLRQELLEASVVPVPANRNALKKAYEAGKITDDFVRAARLAPFLVGVASGAMPSRAMPSRPAGMDETTYRAALAAGIKPTTALRVSEILSRRSQRR